MSMLLISNPASVANVTIRTLPNIFSVSLLLEGAI